jgi:rod shape-determining protein MreC
MRPGRHPFPGGHSDRPRRGRWFLLLCLAGLTIGLLSRNAPNGTWSAPIIRTLTAATAPLQSFGASLASTVGRTWNGWFSGPRRESRLRQLEADIWKLRLENERLRGRAEKASRLERLLKFAKERRTQPVVADVVAWMPSRFYDSITVAAGANYGLHIDQAVRTDTGLVGKIVAVGPRTARVRLITDSESRVSAKVVRDRKIVAQGILVGEGRARALVVRQIKPESTLRAGDVVSTFGDGGVFPPDLPIGIVESVTLSTSRIEKVAVVRPLAPEPGDIREVLVVSRPADTEPANRGSVR